MSAISPDASVIPLLWTGGWDSTFRLLDLVINQRRLVQPYYVISLNRASLIIELRTQARLREMVFADFPDTRERILPTRIYSAAELPLDPEMSKYFLALREKYPIGTQYEWLASFSKMFLESPLELSLTYEGKIRNMLAASVEQVTHQGLLNYQLNQLPQDRDFELFRHFTFPLFQVKKSEMADLAQVGGFRHIMQETWFCHKPVRQHIPCGTCAPCRALIEDGYTERMRSSSLVSYWIYGRTRWIPDVRAELKKYPTLHRTLKRLFRRNQIGYG